MENYINKTRLASKVTIPLSDYESLKEHNVKLMAENKKYCEFLGNDENVVVVKTYSTLNYFRQTNGVEFKDPLQRIKELEIILMTETQQKKAYQNTYMYKILRFFNLL